MDMGVGNECCVVSQVLMGQMKWMMGGEGGEFFALYIETSNSPERYRTTSSSPRGAVFVHI